MDRKKWTIFALPLAMLAVLGTIAWAAATDADAEKAWAAAMTPGAPHARLAERAGEWRAVVTMWNEPGAEPETVAGVAVKTMVMGGRYLQEEFSGEFGGQPFRGVGISGYDNVRKQYVSIWYDNMGTGIHMSNGREDGDGGLTFTATHVDPVTGREMKTRAVSRTIDSAHHAWESYSTLENGREFLHMRVEYTKAGS